MERFTGEQGPHQEGNERNEKPEVKMFFIRHSRASYRAYGEKLGSDEPESPLDLEAQGPDLPEAGREMAQEAAERFLSELNPEQDLLYVVSSTQMRALETAKIYVDTALERGFDVVQHHAGQSDTGDDVTGSLEERVGEGYVRTLHNLSLHMENQVYGAIFMPPAQLAQINWERVSPEMRERFDAARAIVLSDEKGSWGANFHAHAAEIKGIIPDMETPAQLHETQYRNLLRLADFARSQAPGGKRLVVLAFGHENYMSQALEEDTGKASIGNVEAVELTEVGTLKRL